MKQNERLLVYAVTGFLAIILVVAVLFGPSGRDAAAKAGTVAPRVEGPKEPAPTGAGSGAPGLGELLGQKNSQPATGVPGATGAAPAATGAPAGNVVPAAGSVANELSPARITQQQPLVANERPLLAVDLVAQQMGPSRRDRTVRLVRARPGDSLESLVRRWCGARDPFLDEAKSLNEDLVVLRNGQEVCVPWVDDEVVLAAFEASRPKPVAVAVQQPSAVENGSGDVAVPNFAQPGGTTPVGAPRGDAGKASEAPSGLTSKYSVKDGDSLWKIADRTYGRKNAARMIGEIRKANPDVGETLRVGQQIVLPAAP